MKNATEKIEFKQSTADALDEMKTANEAEGKSEQTLPSCDHSASNRLIQAYLNKNNLSGDFGGCGSAKTSDEYGEDCEIRVGQQVLVKVFDDWHLGEISNFGRTRAGFLSDEEIEIAYTTIDGRLRFAYPRGGVSGHLLFDVARHTSNPE